MITEAIQAILPVLSVHYYTNEGLLLHDGVIICELKNIESFEVIADRIILDLLDSVEQIHLTVKGVEM